MVRRLNTERTCINCEYKWIPYKDSSKRCAKCGSLFDKPVKHKVWSSEELARLRVVYPKGSAEDIAKAFPDRPLTGLNEIARKNGIKCLVERCRRGSLAPLLKETPEAYYWAGFFMADGWLSKTNQFVVVSAEKDKSHMEKLAAFLGSKARSISAKHSGFRTKDEFQYRVAVQDIDNGPLFKEKFKLTERKTYNPPDISWISGDNFLAFFAGFSDGDGSINKVGNALSIQNHSSWYNSQIYLAETLKNLTGWKNIRVYIDSRGYSNFKIQGKEVLCQLKATLTKLNIPILKRKWDRLEGTVNVQN